MLNWQWKRGSQRTLKASSLWSLPLISWDPSWLYLCLCLCICVCNCLWPPPWFTCAPSQSFRPTAEGVRWFLLWPPVPTRVDTHVNTEQPKAFPRFSHFDFIFKSSTDANQHDTHVDSYRSEQKHFHKSFIKDSTYDPKMLKKYSKKKVHFFEFSKKYQKSNSCDYELCPIRIFCQFFSQYLHINLL